MKYRPAKIGAGQDRDSPYAVLCQPDVGFTLADQTELRQALHAHALA